MTQTKRLIFAALCVAMGVALPLAFHSIPNAGGIFLPMHIPVLLCGLVCGWPYGLACGALAPLLSSLLTGMPPAAVLPGMLFELCVYGLSTGILVKRINTGKRLADLYVSLILAMLLGRMTYGLLNALIFKAGAYSLKIWLTTAFVTGLPGILIQLALIPPLLRGLEKAGIAGTAAGKRGETH